MCFPPFPCSSQSVWAKTRLSCGKVSGNSWTRYCRKAYARKWFPASIHALRTEMCFNRPNMSPNTRRRNTQVESGVCSVSSQVQKWISSFRTPCVSRAGLGCQNGLKPGPPLAWEDGTLRPHSGRIRWRLGSPSYQVGNWPVSYVACRP